MPCIFQLRYVDRDYIWAPPPSGYVDECLAQVELDGHIDHVIQDVGYDVVALVDAGKPAATPGYPNGAAAKVLIQYTYDAYGQPITAEDLTSSPPGRTPGGNLSPSAAGNSSGASATGGGDIYGKPCVAIPRLHLSIPQTTAPSTQTGRRCRCPRSRPIPRWPPG
jgi:hypothetical protein